MAEAGQRRELPPAGGGQKIAATAASLTAAHGSGDEKTPDGSGLVWSGTAKERKQREDKRGSWDG